MAKTVKPKAEHKRSILQLIPRHGAFPLAAAAGIIAFIAGQFWWSPLAIVIGANAWFVTYLGVVFYELPRMTPERLKAHADQEAPPVGLIMLVTVGVIAVSAFSLFSALNSGGSPKPEQVVFGIVSVALGWFVVHTMAGLHYAYEFYEAPEAGGKPGDISGGLEWPKGDKPNGVAFLYLASQIGAALQVSDTPVTTNKMRGLILIHTIFAFFYNTMLVAASINIVVAAGASG